jgi:branched-chain amino acid transport system ATP-binding protein
MTTLAAGEEVTTMQSAALELDGVTSGYGSTVVLRNVSLTIPAGRIVALLGPNGAGKTTLLRTAAGILLPSAGAVRIGGKEATRLAPNRRAKAGLCLIPEGRGIFRSLTVAENLRLQVPAWQRERSYEQVLDVFPVLRERLGQTAGTMSGGQQQMLALARAYLCRPGIVLLDEVSMGLAPRVVDEIFEALRTLAASGTSLLLVEQYVTRALELADAAVLLNRCEIVFQGTVAQLDQDQVMRGYLGVPEATPTTQETV